MMLDNVSLGFELWRQFNAFPPTVDRSEDPLGKPGEKSEKPAEADVKGPELKRKSKAQ